jgi:hypothetical protein
MATEDAVNRGAYVHRLSKGFRRWFFNASVPLEYLHVDCKKLAADPEGAAMEVAQLLDRAITAALAGGQVARRVTAAAHAPACVVKQAGDDKHHDEHKQETASPGFDARGGDLGGPGDGQQG